MNTNPSRGNAGFSLIELMAVITIIVILAGLVVGGMGFVNQRQAMERAKIQIALLSNAIEEYKSDMGAYPGTLDGFGGAIADGEDGDYSEVLYNALFFEGYDYDSQEQPDSWLNKATKVYLRELDPVSNKQGWTSIASSAPEEGLKIIDPWGSAYRYRVGKNAQNPDFDLWSMGKDGKSKPDSPADSTNKDDIRNF